MRQNLITMTPGDRPTPGQKAQMDRKFGMFLHFGINTFGNVEWSDGTLPVSLYRPSAVDAGQWVRTAYEAGMNYVILTTKHHDGFCLWDTKGTDYCVSKSPNPADVVRKVSEACGKYGLKLGLYYSLWDRHEPSYRDDFEGGYVGYMLDQLTELMDGRYGEVVELWLDGSWDKSCADWRLDRIYDLVKRLQPDCQVGVNHTIGEYSGAACGPDEKYRPENYRLYDPIRMFPSDFRLWDPYLCREDDPKLYTFRGQVYYMPFEQTICSRKGFSWFYSDRYEEKPLTDADEIVRNYKTLAKSGNSMVINTPPDVRGKLVRGDVDNLMRAAEKLGISRGL